MPSEPVSMAAQSDRMSPKRLSVTMTSNCLGLRTSCMAQLSAYMWLSSTFGELALVVHPWTFLAPQHAGLSITLAFSTDMSAGPVALACASSKATAATTRRISGVV